MGTLLNFNLMPVKHRPLTIYRPIGYDSRSQRLIKGMQSFLGVHTEGFSSKENSHVTLLSHYLLHDIDVEARARIIDSLPGSRNDKLELSVKGVRRYVSGRQNRERTFYALDIQDNPVLDAEYEAIREAVFEVAPNVMMRRLLHPHVSLGVINGHEENLRLERVECLAPEELVVNAVKIVGANAPRMV